MINGAYWEFSRFYSRLAKLKHKIKWVKNHRGSGQIRGTIRHGKYKGKIVCPLRAIYWADTGIMEEGYTGRSRAHTIKTYGVARPCKIEVAADRKNSMFNPDLQDVRNSLLDSLGFGGERVRCTSSIYPR